MKTRLTKLIFVAALIVGVLGVTGVVWAAVTINATSVTSDGALTLTGATASTWSTTAGALTITAAAASTWSTTTGDLTLDPAGDDVILLDNTALSLGTGADSRLYYDGTDTFLNLRAVGTGDLMIALAGGFPSPDAGGVHIWKGTAGVVTADGTSAITLENAGDIRLTFLAPSANQGGLAVGDPDSPVVGQFLYNHVNDSWDSYIAAAMRLRHSAGAFAFQEATTISATGILTVNGTTRVHFNAASADVDFRVEGLSNANLITVDAGQDNIGIGNNPGGTAFLTIGANFTGSGAGTSASMILTTASLTGASGDTGFLYGIRFASRIITQTATENIADIAQITIEEPDITDNLTGDITRASTLLINNIPTEGVTNAGLMIDGGASLDSYLAIASSSVTTGLSTAVNGDDVATDWFFSIEKVDVNQGGVLLKALAEDAAVSSSVLIDAYGGTAGTGKTTSGAGLVNIRVFEHNGANALADITADGNVFSVQARVGGSTVTRFMVDEDGDTYQNGSVNFFGAGTIATASGDLTLNPTGEIIFSSQIETTGTAPALTSCGTTPSITGSDTAGKVTIGTGVTTSCTATFNVAYDAAPACTIAGDNTAVTYAATTSTTVLTITSSADMASDVISYICVGL